MEDLLNTEIISGKTLSDLLTIEFLASILGSVLAAILILFVGFIIGGWARRRLNNLGLQYKHLDETLFNFLGNIARYVIIGFAFLFVLNTFGVQTTSFVAVIGAAGLAIGLALQGTLSNLAAGVMLLAFRPFKMNDFVDVGGHSGTVKAISLFTTELATSDNVQITIPNGDIWASSIVNYSFYDRRRCDLTIGVAYDADLKKTETVLRAIIAADKRALTEPEAFVKVTNLGDSSVDFTVRVWALADDYWAMRHAIIREVKDQFDKAGIDIPFPTALHIQVPATPAPAVKAAPAKKPAAKKAAAKKA